MSIWRLPSTVIIHLKRFSYTNSIWRGGKVNDEVCFPVSGLDLSPYFKGVHGGEETAPYDLYGVINHHGSLLGGHYSSFARCPLQSESDRNSYGWRLFNDHKVSQCNEGEVMTRYAYVLFYQKRNQPTRDQVLSHCTPGVKATTGLVIDNSDDCSSEDDGIENRKEEAYSDAPNALPIAAKKQRVDSDSDVSLDDVIVAKRGLYGETDDTDINAMD
jgi:hypothetical protein